MVMLITHVFDFLFRPAVPGTTENTTGVNTTEGVGEKKERLRDLPLATSSIPIIRCTTELLIHSPKEHCQHTFGLTDFKTTS